MMLNDMMDDKYETFDAKPKNDQTMILLVNVMK